MDFVLGQNFFIVAWVRGALWRWSGLVEEADFSGLGEGLAFQPVRNRFNPAGQVHHLFKGSSLRKMGPPLGR